MKRIPLMMPVIERIHEVWLRNCPLKDFSAPPQLFDEERRKYSPAKRNYDEKEVREEDRKWAGR